MQHSQEAISQHNLTGEEYARICALLGREPNLTELGIFSVMWSEHCSYKSSRVHLKKLPTQGPRIVQGPGENAGIVEVGDGLVAVFKIESHNHPSYIEPYQGAATGAGGIIRDIFTMGARPIALMGSLHFGPPEASRNRHIMEGVVAGVGGYGNCIGIPTVGGETLFHPSYSHNPIVNVFCLGIAKASDIFYGRAHGVGNPVIYVGSKTGRDGIHGATMASAEFDEESSAKRPTVQVGDPFMEKLLLEACLEAMKSGLVVGIQDMGAAGLTCSSCEMGSRAGTGIRIDLTRVPKRETHMTPYEIMLSESQERMLLVGQRGKESELLSIFRKWGLDAVVIGDVTDTGRLQVLSDGECVADIPNKALTDEAPLYKRPWNAPPPRNRPSWQDRERNKALPLAAAFEKLLASPHLASKRWIYEQYDHMVRTNTRVMPGSDAAVLRIKGTRKGLAMTLDGNPRFCQLNPREGARLAVAEACRNLVCTGAQPIAATNCLNFGNPETPEIMWQFVEVIEGMAEACRLFETPITGGNVSFYNETLGEGIPPTPVIGMVGLLEDEGRATPAYFRRDGDAILLAGGSSLAMGGSLYGEIIYGQLFGELPVLDPESERRLHTACLEGIRAGWIASAHDCSDGGLALCLMESMFLNPLLLLGCRVQLPDDAPLEEVMFSEAPSRIVLTAAQENRPALEKLFAAYRVPLHHLGTVEGKRFMIQTRQGSVLDASCRDLKSIWESSLESIIMCPA